MVDNFELIKSLLKFENPGDCYYVQLLRRQSDDPKINGVPDPKYHGNMHSRSIKDYFVCSTDYLDAKKDEIISLCKEHNVRAYIRLNKRTYKNIALAMLKHITEQLCSGETFSSPFHMVASAAGKANSAGSEKTWIVDIDKEFLPYEDEIRKLIEECEPLDKTKILATIPTKSGKHIITYPFNKQTLMQKWMIHHPDPLYHESTGEKVSMFDIHKDNPTILYVPDPPVVK